jgi:hypothetical protein
MVTGLEETLETHNENKDSKKRSLEDVQDSPKSKALKPNVSPSYRWGYVALFAGSGCVYEYKLCISEEEYTRSYEALDPVVGDYWGCFSYLGLSPVLNSNEAIEAFEMFFGDFQGDLSDFSCEEEEIALRTANLVNKQREKYKYDEWLDYAKENPSESLESLKDSFLFHMGYFLKNDIDIDSSSDFPWTLLLSTEEDREIFAEYVLERFGCSKSKDGDQLDFGHESAYFSVFSFEGVQKQIEEDELNEWS